MKKQNPNPCSAGRTASRLVPSSASHWLVGLVAAGAMTLGGGASADAGIGTFLPTISGGHNKPIEYGANTARNTSIGTTRLETSGGSGQNFFVYVKDNLSGESERNLNSFSTWKVSGLADDFPAGFSAVISPLPAGTGRASASLGKVTRTAPDAMSVSSSDAESVTLAWKPGPNNVPDGTLVGWEITLSAIPPAPAKASKSGMSLADLKEKGGVLQYSGVWDWEFENTSSFELDLKKDKVKYVYNGSVYMCSYKVADNANGNAVLDFNLDNGDQAQFEWADRVVVKGRFWGKGVAKTEPPRTQTTMRPVPKS